MAPDQLCTSVVGVVSLCIAFYQLGRNTLRQAMKQEVQTEFDALNTKIDSLVSASKAKDSAIAALQTQLANADQSGEVIAALKVSEAKIDAALPPEPAPEPEPVVTVS